MGDFWRYALSAVIAYLLGSVSAGMLVSRIGHGPNLRKVGSKSTGASNVQRTMGWGSGLITFVGDCGKAVLACWIGRLLTGSLYGAMLAGVFVTIGHNWPCFFDFNGGKGVACSCGIMLMTFPIPAVICYVLTIGLIALTRYISVGSMSMLSIFAVIVSVWYSGGDIWIILWTVLLALLCIWRHAPNIARLLRGEENKLGHKAKTES